MLLARLFNSSVLSEFIKHKHNKAPLALLALVMLTGLSCGKRKPPLPPQERVRQRVEISGFQRGSRVILSWKMPARNAADGSVQNISRADIYRVAESAGSPLTLSEEEFASRSVLIASVPIADSDFALKTFSYTDILEFAGQPARLRYAIRFVNASGQKASFSNFFLIEPAARVAGAPTSLSAEITQDTVNFVWRAPDANADGTLPLNLLGYNVYRSASEKETSRLLNSTPVSNTRYSDQFFEFGTKYFYFVRAVSVGNDGIPIESAESNIVQVSPKDTFSPTPPTAISLAASINSVSIFFATNLEKDVVGYRIYRSTDAGLQKTEWMLLTPELLTTNTFRDTRVESGKTYHYYLTAVDNAGNISEPSEVVSETVQ